VIHFCFTSAVLGFSVLCLKNAYQEDSERF
jgi:hypothetical protein